MKAEEEKSYLERKVLMREIIVGIMVIMVLNIAALCLYRYYQKRRRMGVMKDVVNNEVSKYFKIASTEQSVESP